VGTGFGVLVGFAVKVGRGVLVSLGVLVGFGVLGGTAVFVDTGIGVLVGGGGIGVLVGGGGIGVSVSGITGVAVETGVKVNIGEALELMVRASDGVLVGVSDGLLPGGLVFVIGMKVLEGVEVEVAEGVLLGAVMGISSVGAAVSGGTGVLSNKNRDGFVGVKKSLANASWVNARSAGVALAVTCGCNTTPACRSTLSPDNRNGMPNARRQMTGIARNITKP